MTVLLMVFFVVFPTHLNAKPSLRQNAVSTLPQWNDFIVRQNRSLAKLDACKSNPQLCSSDGIQKWSGLLNTLEEENKLHQIIVVNRWFNRIPYKYDEYAYNTLDYWADTAQLINQKGDCEDYALAKYFTLRQLGFSEKDLKITIVYDQDQYLNHAVLMVTVDGSRYLMDINSDSMDPSPMEYRYKPLYSFNEQFAWYY